MVNPEIPDSSKWSSNKRSRSSSPDLQCLKYQIPVSGVQTSDNVKDSEVLAIPEIPDSSKWSSNFMRVYDKMKELMPEIPDSSKWSSN